MDENALELSKREARAFERKSNLHSLWHEIALNFYSARADFMSESPLGAEYAIDQFDATPELCRRDLADARASMMRPDGQGYFDLSTGNKKLDERPDIAPILELMGERGRVEIERPTNGARRALRESDNDIVAFGNAVLSAESEIGRDGRRRLLVRSWHLRDCAWFDDASGTYPDVMFRRFKASARNIEQVFGRDRLHDEIKAALDKKNGNPDREFDLCHVMLPASEYDWYEKPGGAGKAPWASVYYDSAHNVLLRERPSQRFRYVVDRWAMISGTPYAYSPASMVSLSTARGLQTAMRILLEAGEKSLDPPLRAANGAVVSDIDQSAGGITWVDRDYDERLGPAITNLLPEARNIPLGADMILGMAASLRDAWYLSKLRLPTRQKTAYETSAVLQEFIRENLPLFGPWQTGLSMILDEIYGVLMSREMFGSVFGSPMDWPPELLGNEDISFTFNNPLRDSIERVRVEQAQQVLGFAAAAEKVEPGYTKRRFNIDKIGADFSRGAGAPSDWLNDDAAAAEAADANGQAADILGALGMAERAAGVVRQGADAAAALQGIDQPAAADSSFVYGPA